MGWYNHPEIRIARDSREVVVAGGPAKKGVADRHNYRKADNNNDRESNDHEACLHQNSGETVGCFIDQNSHNNYRGADHEYDCNKPLALWKCGCEPLDLVN